MFERYTEKARRVVFFARYEASQFGSPSIETEHFLLGLLREDKALFRRVRLAGGAAEAIRKEIEAHTPPVKKTPVSVDLPVSNDCKQALAYATEEAERSNHTYIGTEHLLLGLLRVERCFGARLLDNKNITLERVREAVGGLEDPRQADAPSPLSPSLLIDEFCIDLTQQAVDGLLPPLIGREPELERIIQILCRRTQANPLVVGEPGVGKKTIVYGLAQRISGKLIPRLVGWRMLSLDLAVIAASVKSRTRLEENLEGILGELYYDQTELILVLDSLLSLAQTPQFLSLANVIKPALFAGRIRCISRAMPSEYLKAVEAAPWLAQQFSVIEVKPATEIEAIEVLTGVKDRFEKFHGVVFSEEAIRYAVFHSNSYFPDRYLPEKAIDLMDEAGARVKLRQPALPDEMREVQKRIRFVAGRHSRALDNNESEKAQLYKDELKKELENLENRRKKLDLPDASTATVTREDIDQIVSQRTGAPIELLRKSREQV
jgi:ATP-dependent Clp protease ATP-binding subunit ClpC